MGIRFILLVNKQGQTRLAQYYEYMTLEERRALEGEIVRKCLTRTDQQVFSGRRFSYACLILNPLIQIFLLLFHLLFLNLILLDYSPSGDIMS